MSVRPKQLARLGEFHLEEAILDVLLESRHENECIGPADISSRAGIFREGGDKTQGEPASMNDAIVTGILIKLMKAKRVERCEQTGGKGGWQLAEKEFDKRRDD